MKRFLRIALPVSLAVWFSVTAVGANLPATDQSPSYSNADSELQPTTYTCTWILWRGSWWCI